MPRRDGTGPDGQGSRTGRGLGMCGTRGNQANNASSQNVNNGTSSFWGFGRGLARGLGRAFGRGSRRGGGRGMGRNAQAGYQNGNGMNNSSPRGGGRGQRNGQGN